VVAFGHRVIGSIAALKEPRLHPTTSQLDLLPFGHKPQGENGSHFHQSVLISLREYAPTDFLKNLHLQHAPTFITAFIPARVKLDRGPRRPEEAEVADTWLLVE
jgi:hypothetical protein